MESLKIGGEIRLMVNDDPNRVISFIPSDQLFAEKFYRLLKNFEEKVAEFKAKAAEIDGNQMVDEFGLPQNAEEGLALQREVCEFMHQEIDGLFGSGTSKAAFGDVLSFDYIEQFFDGITPHVEKVRRAKMSKYARKKQEASSKVMRNAL